MCDCNAPEIRNLKGQVRSIDLAFRNAEADLAVTRYDLADTKKTLDKYRGMHDKMSKANSELKKTVADLNETLATITEDRDLACELFQGMVSAYVHLWAHHSKTRDDYAGDAFNWRSDSKYDKR